MLRVVLDANVLVSAIFGGLPERAVQRAMKEEIWISREVEKELLGLSRRLGGCFNPLQQVRWNENLLLLLSGMKHAVVRSRVSICRDAKDNAYLSLAKAVQADFLVTGDQDLLSIPAVQLEHAGLSHLSIATPRRFLKVLC